MKKAFKTLLIFALVMGPTLLAISASAETYSQASCPDKWIGTTELYADQYCQPPGVRVYMSPAGQVVTDPREAVCMTCDTTARQANNKPRRQTFHTRIPAEVGQ